jgi:subtilisin family serine protease
MNILNVLLLVLFASSVSAGCRRHHGEVKDGDHRKKTLNVPLQAVGGVIQDEYLVYHDKGLEPRGLLDGLIKSGQAEILNEYTLMDAFSVRIKRELLNIALINIENIEIFDNPVVSALELDSPVYAWGVDRTDQTTAGMNNQYEYERDGTNVDVYILDTGIYIEHNDFEGRASHGADFTGEGDGDGRGHGTHVAGTLH